VERHAHANAIIQFVTAARTEGDRGYIAAAQRVSVFDNDGTLWCEKPMPIELGFILQRLAEMCEADTSLRDRQPWKAAHECDYAWLGGVITKHYHGDDTDVKVLMGGILRAFSGMTVEGYEEIAAEFLRGPHPTLGRTYRQCGYRPMIELLRYLEANGFTSFIASGGDRDFITKPVRIWSRVGRRPVLAAGNSNGDIPMLHYTGGPARRGLRLLVLHDDPEREFDYTTGAERSLEYQVLEALVDGLRLAHRLVELAHHHLSDTATRAP
jgi:phosphoserine phosphatase